MDRRRFLMSAAAFASPLPPGAIPAGNELAFKVFRNGTQIGEHHLSFDQAGDGLTVTINVALAVKFAGFTVFTYALHAMEKWEAGRFARLHSMVNHNGTQLEVEAHQIDAGYLVTGTNHTNPAKTWPQYVAPPDTLPLTYWNKAFLNANILNIETAHSYRCPVSSPGWNALPTASGGTITAQRFDVTGKLHLSVWYDQNNAWSGLEFHFSGDEVYQKIV
jgi:hypothetical protein